MVRLTRFKAEHLLALVPRDLDDDAIFDSAWRKEQSPSFTAWDDDKIIACAGVIIQMPGVGFAWTTFGSDFIKHRLWITKTIYRALRDIIKGCNLHRVEAHIMVDKRSYHKWIELFGFERDGIAEQGTSDKRNVHRYVWLRDKLRIVQVGALNGLTRQFEARLGDTIAGYAAHSYTPEENYAYGVQCIVEPAYHGRGIGLALHRARLECAKRDGAEFFVGMSDNPAMQRILMKCGARRCPTEYGITYVKRLV